MISGMTQETLKWKLFPFSLTEIAKSNGTRVSWEVQIVIGMIFEIGSVLHSSQYPMSFPCVVTTLLFWS
jgi:hypothetical protein